MKKLTAEERSTENLAVELGLYEMEPKQQSEFFVDYICSLEGVFTNEVLADAGTTFDDMLDLANRINYAVEKVSK